MNIGRLRQCSFGLSDPVASANEATKRSAEEVRRIGCAKEVRRWSTTSSDEPDRSGATSKMWIDGAKPQARVYPLATDSNTLEAPKMGNQP